MEDTFKATLDAARRIGVRFVDDSPPSAVQIQSPNGHHLNFVDWGKDGDGKPVVIFIHGFLQQARTWDFTCLALRSRFRCISLDLRGHGESGRPPKPDYNTHFYLSDLRRFVDHFTNEMHIDRFALVGLSLGGQLSYVYAAENPDIVDAIVVVDVAPETNRQASRGVNRFITALPREGTFEELVDKVAKMSPMRTRDAVRGSLLRATRAHDNGTWEWKHDTRLLEHHGRSYTPDDFWAALSKVTAPALFVLGRNSKLVTSDVVRRMVETVPGSSATYVPDASHRVPGDNPIGFIRAVAPFLDRYVLNKDVLWDHDVERAQT